MSGGTTFHTSESSWPIDAPIDYPIEISAADLAAYRPPDPTAPGRDRGRSAKPARWERTWHYSAA